MPNPFTRYRRLAARVNALEALEQELNARNDHIEHQLQTMTERYNEIMRMFDRRLDALERANWQRGIENNCTECREVWSK